MTKTMRALVARSFGEPADVLQIEERSMPEPGPQQVRIRTEAPPIHASDLNTLRDRYGYTVSLPAVMGLESVGIVDALGDGVDGLSVGQRVIPMGIPGTWQEYLVADKAKVLPVPTSWSRSSAAQVLVNPVTAVVLAQELKLRKGNWLIQTAAASTVGKMIIQLGRIEGFQTINLVRHRSAENELLGLGADAVICTGDEDLHERILEIAGENAVSKALDCVGGPLGAEVFRSLAPSGEMLIYGALSSHRQADAEKLTLPLPASSIIYGTKTVRGFWLLNWVKRSQPAEIQAVVSKTMKLVSAGDFVIPEGVPYRLDQYVEAVTAAESPARGGKSMFLFN
jgi:NADPH:quinone reductase-like Zn-dependent oxidoreductase